MMPPFNPGACLAITGRPYRLYRPQPFEMGSLSNVIPMKAFRSMMSPDIQDRQDIIDILNQEWAQHWVFLDANACPCGLIRILPEMTGGISMHGMGWTPSGSSPTAAQRAYTTCWIALHSLLLETNPVLLSYAWRSNVRALRTLQATGYRPMRIRTISGIQVHMELRREPFRAKWGTMAVEKGSTEPQWAMAGAESPDERQGDLRVEPISWSEDAQRDFLASAESPWAQLLPAPERFNLSQDRKLGELTIAKPRLDLHHVIWHPTADWTSAELLDQALHQHTPVGSTLALDSTDPCWTVLMNSIGRYLGQGPEGQHLWQR